MLTHILHRRINHTQLHAALCVFCTEPDLTVKRFLKKAHVIPWKRNNNRRRACFVFTDQSRASLASKTLIGSILKTDSATSVCVHS